MSLAESDKKPFILVTAVLFTVYLVACFSHFCVFCWQFQQKFKVFKVAPSTVLKRCLVSLSKKWDGPQRKHVGWISIIQV